MKKTFTLLAFLISTFIFGQATAIPDPNFEQALIDLGYDDVIDGSIITANINTVTSLSVSNKNISDLTGIEDFGALTDLLCWNNQLTEIDVSQNTALSYLKCNSNQITSLDLSNNTQLTNLKCYNNDLIDLDLSQNPNLTYLRCENNRLVNLNVKNGNNTNFTTFKATNNPDLSCIEVDDSNWSTASWSDIDPNSSFGNNCTTRYRVDINIIGNGTVDLSPAGGVYDIGTTINLTAIGDTGWQFDNWSDSIIGTVNPAVISSIQAHKYVTVTFVLAPQTAIPDQNFEQALINLGYDDIIDENVLTSNINTITILNLDNNDIADLTGIQDFTALTELYLRNNQLESIDVSNNLQLSKLNFYNNQISNIDLSQNVNLTELITVQNPLEALDLTQNSLLTKVNCINNSLTSFDIRNGNNTAISDLNFSLLGNNDLTCVFVDDASWSTTNWTYVPASLTFVNNQTDCTALSINDNLFSSKISIYPNPAKNTINIQNESNYPITKIALYDMFGKLIYHSNTVEQIYTNHLSNGLYLIKISSNNKTVSKKIVVSK